MRRITKTLLAAAAAAGAALVLAPAVSASAAPQARTYLYTSLSECDAKQSQLAQRGHHILIACKPVYSATTGAWTGEYQLRASVRPVGTP